MSTDTHTSAGSMLHICASQPATYDAAGYAALTWIEVGEITDFGEFGREYNLVKHNPVKTRGTQKFKGSFDEGAMAVQMASSAGDAGQVLMKAASASDSNYSFRVTTQELDKYYFQGLVMNFKLGIGGVDQMTSASANVELTTTSAGVGIVPSLA